MTGPTFISARSSGSRECPVFNMRRSHGAPLTGNAWPGMVEIERHPVTKPTDRFALPLRSVTPGYFALVGLTITDGRDFRATDIRTAPPVAVVNQALADRYFVGTSAIGRKLWLGGRDRPATEIVGIVSDAPAI